MKSYRYSILLGCAAVLLSAGAAQAGVSPGEAEKLKTTLTPMGAEKAGSADGTIPAWTGGYNTPDPNFVNGGRRSDPFAGDKPLFSITAANMNQYADKLSDGVKAQLKAFPDSYRLDVYQTRRTAIAPQWVYDNIYENATRAKMNADGYTFSGAYGGIPFPIPQSGTEVMWNHLTAWRGVSHLFEVENVLITAEGRQVVSAKVTGDVQMPYYFQDGSAEAFDKSNGDYYLIRVLTSGPPIRAGEAITGRLNVDSEKDKTWVYLTGQRRSRLLPNGCCDTPTPATSGIMNFDDLEVFYGRLSRFNWKILGKKEMYIPYNGNRLLVPTKRSETLLANFLNPDYVRWELHRVWVIEATVAPGQRHTSPHGIYYVDEDTWRAELGDRWASDGSLWKTNWQINFVAPDVPAVVQGNFGFYDLVSKAWYSAFTQNESKTQYKLQPRYSDETFTPDAMSGESIR